jgi:hypothetical protein
MLRSPLQTTVIRAWPLDMQRRTTAAMAVFLWSFVSQCTPLLWRALVEGTPSGVPVPLHRSASANHTCDSVGILRFLWDKFDAKKATDDELEYLSSATDVARTRARGIADELFDMALTVSSERFAGLEVKKLNGVELSIKLGNISDEMRLMSQLTFIGSEASFEEKKRLEEKAKVPRPKARA